LCGVLAAPALLVPGVWGAVLGVVAVQLYLLLDCVDGEVARWKKQFSGEWEMTAMGEFVKSRTVRGMVKPAAQAL
ncbi:hypothetical protein PUR26_00540, partial [Streptomyces sp. SP18CS02]|nr:hypothetical protein [Streptomyces sp. SP18CS02]